MKTAIIFHVALEKTGSNSTAKSLQCMKRSEEGKAARTTEATQTADITCYGKNPVLEEFELYVIGDTNNKLIEGPVVGAAQVPEDSIWKAKCELDDLAKVMERIANPVYPRSRVYR